MITGPCFLPMIGTTIRPASAGLFHVNLWEALRANDAFGLACIAVLGAFSVYSWAIIIRKWIQFRRAMSQTDRFARHCQESKGDLYAAFSHAQRHQDSPLAGLLHEAYVEMEMEGWYRGEAGLSREERARQIREHLDKILNRSIEYQMRLLEDRLPVLATTANVCPFIGLLGTVWGVLSAFQVVGQTGTASIQAIAPGVSTALMTTVIGLIAAIPAVMAYNYFASRVQNLSSRMDSFANELTSILEKFALGQE